RRCPAHERRHRARRAADDDVLRRRAFQPACVDEDVEEVADEREHRGQHVHGACEEDERECRQREPELEGAAGSDSARGDGAAPTSSPPSAQAARAACAPLPGTAAAAANSAEAPSTPGTSSRCASQADTSSAASGGATSAASSRCAVPRPAAPETTASIVPA